MLDELQRKKSRRTIAEINVVPYIDVMLVLLIIFMATAPMINQGVDVNLPVASAKPLKQNNNIPVIVTVDKNGNNYLSISQIPTKKISNEVLKSEVAAALTLNPSRQIVVRADKDVNYNNVLQTMTQLQMAGVANVALETEME